MRKLLISFGLLATTCIITFVVLYKAEQSAKLAKAERAAAPVSVAITEIHRGPQTITVEASGTVRAGNTVVLQAPFSGRALATKQWNPGDTVAANEPIFRMSTEALRSEVADLETQIERLDGDKSKKSVDRNLVLARIETAKELFQIASQRFDGQKEAVAIEEQLFTSNEEMHAHKNLATMEFLAAKNRLISARLSLLETRQAMENARDNLSQLRLALNAIDHEVDTMTAVQVEMKQDIANLNREMEKAELRLPFAVQIKEIFTDGNEVVSGTPLAKLRNNDTVEMTIDFPHTHLGWLYAGKLMQEMTADMHARTPLSLTILDQDEPKVFGGAFIKSVGEAVQHADHSLPIVIARSNPLTADATPLPEDELKPGTLCRVTLPLSEVQDAYRIPRSAMQSGGRLLCVTKDKESDKLRLHSIDKVEVLHDTGSDLIVKLPEEYSDLQLITQPLKGVPVGTVVRVNS